MDNIENLIEELTSEDCFVTLECWPTQSSDEEQAYCAILRDIDSNEVILDRNGDLFLRAFGASFKEALNNLNKMAG
jgi:hypothetical protein